MCGGQRTPECWTLAETSLPITHSVAQGMSQNGVGGRGRKPAKLSGRGNEILSSGYHSAAA